MVVNVTRLIMVPLLRPCLFLTANSALEEVFTMAVISPFIIMAAMSRKANIYYGRAVDTRPFPTYYL